MEAFFFLSFFAQSGYHNGLDIRFAFVCLVCWFSLFHCFIFSFDFFFYLTLIRYRPVRWEKLVLRGLKGVDVIICQAGWRKSDNGSFNQVGNLF